MKSPARILIVKLSSLGDVVHTLPVVQDLRAAFPGARIDWVVERGFAPLVARCEGVERVIPCELRAWTRKPWAAATRQAWRAFKADLQTHAYDAVMDLQGLSKSALVAWLARTTPTGYRYAMANQTDGSGYEAPTRWVADKTITLEPHVHAVARGRLLCAAAGGYPVPERLVFGLRGQGAGLSAPLPKHLGHAENPFVPKKPLVALVHGTSRVDKEWPLEHWVALGQRLNDAGFGIALPHAGARELATSRALAAALKDAWVLPAVGLDVLTDTLAHCAGVIGVDSGVSHIAVALDLPHVQIYNFDTAWRTGPLATTVPGRPARQCSVYAAPCPEVDTVWAAWESLATPVLCR
ncbi:lipopolysaccharide heptosyltransferase I [Rhodoferax sp.]|uniref:lipopolysaccharide heptosyltransferase I n=1 Tax=Rhodoferax sp. TaxID=50421 RepID=UPI0025E402EC|nr:lipopolysaccharide heptosyltransferase I [Rhodoferax sp.]